MSFESSSTVNGFPVGARVILHGLMKGAQYNGEVGVIQTSLQQNKERQQVLVKGKHLAIRPGNLRYEPRDIDTLSIKELTYVLKQKDPNNLVAGMDKSELKEMVQDQATPTEIAELLAHQHSTTTTTTTSTSASGGVGGMTEEQIQNGAERMSNVSPEQLRQQAAMMRSMDPATLRRMNPQMANFTDEQIKMAANQMETMANNPSMMKMAAEQMKHMSPQDLSNMQRQATTTSTTNTGSRITKEQMETQAQQMSNMSPEQLKQQAQALRSMDPATIRRMNPQMANMTDEQIQMAATQMEAMADNPDMLKMASEQMKNMSPDDLSKMQQEFASGNGMADMANHHMDAKQMKSAMKMMKKNPEMMKQMMKTQGMDEAQADQAMAMMDKLDDKQMEQLMNAMAGFQKYTAPIRNTWNKTNTVCGGHLKKIILTLLLILVTRYFFFSSSHPLPPSSSLSPPSSPLDTIQKRNKIPTIEELEQDEF